MVLGVNIARGLASLIPGVGTGLNAVVAAGLQETIGWGAYLLLEEGRDINQLADFIKNRRSDIDARSEQEKHNKEKIKKAVEGLSPEKLQRYSYLEEQIKRKDISDATKAEYQEELIAIVDEAIS